MSEASILTRPPLFAIIACTVSALIFGALCWNSTLPSDAEPTTRDNLFLLMYECLSLISYLGTLLYFARISTFRALDAIVTLFLISLFATIIPYVVSSTHIWVTHQLNLRWFLQQAAVAWLIYVALMFTVMTVTSLVVSLMTLPFRDKTRHTASS